jgi:outer membrane protein assembly factor BamB
MNLITSSNEMRDGIIITLALFVSSAHAENNWPQWRGSNGMGQSSESGLPVKWDASSVEWKVVLPGQGQSSPVIWGEQIYLTSSLENGKTRVVFCIDRKKGELLWEQTAWEGEPEKTHSMNMFASPTCATDGDIVVAFFGRGGLHCYDKDGKKAWSVDLGAFDGTWGTGASPIIVGDLVIQNCDAEGVSSLVAFDKKTGSERWRARRPEMPRGGWSTPLLIDTGARKELVLNGEFGVQAYDPVAGEELWFCKGFNGRGTPTPVFAHGLLYVVNGKPGDIYSVRPGGSGDVTKTHMAWHTPRTGGRDLPSPIVVGESLFVVNLQPGIGTIYAASTGTQLTRTRLEGKFSASPIASDGLIYVVSEAGDTIVIRPGQELEILSRNSVGSSQDEVFRASPAVSDGQIFLRSDQTLYCIGKRRK